MNWLGWLWLVIAAGGLYWFAQILVYLLQASKRLRAALSVTSTAVASLSELPEVSLPRIQPTQTNQRAEIIAARRRRSRAKAAEATRRERRLVSRIEKLMSEGGKSV